MKRVLLSLTIAVMTIVATSELAQANSGKNKKAKVQVNNTNSVGGRAITIFIVPEGTPTPTTKAQALVLAQKSVGAGKTEQFDLKNGTYSIAAADTIAFGLLANSDPIPANSFTVKTGIVLNNDTKAFTTSTPPGATLPFKPNLN